MRFKVHPVGPKPSGGNNEAILITDDWDDWFKYSTMYFLVVFDTNGDRHDIGSVKIGQFGMETGQRRPTLPAQFEALDSLFFSVGQDDEYYVHLNQLGPETRDEILTALRDLAKTPGLLQDALREDVTRVSLLRSVSEFAVANQFNRLAKGSARLTGYDFTFVLPSTGREAGSPLQLTFQVVPESNPPTNIHVLIGRNGVGKTHLLRMMVRSLTHPGSSGSPGSFLAELSQSSSGIFANLVSVTFSAFDPFDHVSNTTPRQTQLTYSYVGLQQGRTAEGKSRPPKSTRTLEKEFVASAVECRIGNRRHRWLTALQSLESDPLFHESEIVQLASHEDHRTFASSAGRYFRRLSSGHKVVLLTVTRLVEKVEEKSLVLLDEPEAHLHPPLLSAFIRALATLLIDRNGVAIVATHSPVVLQEVPATCVWKLRRSGRATRAERPSVETFGENVGVLTHEVFGLEVTDSGFHRLLHNAVDEGLPYEGVLQRFAGQLGAEAKAISQALVLSRLGSEDRP